MRKKVFLILVVFVTLVLVNCSAERVYKVAEVTEAAGEVVTLASPVLGPYAPLGAAVGAVITGISGILYQRSQGKGKEKSFNAGMNKGVALGKGSPPEA
tara:strand:+ start:389 stop:685 length:297 start_codon:yes stop_codon:yes gene_type:complete